MLSLEGYWVHDLKMIKLNKLAGINGINRGIMKMQTSHLQLSLHRDAHRSSSSARFLTCRGPPGVEGGGRILSR